MSKVEKEKELEKEVGKGKVKERNWFVEDRKGERGGEGVGREK